jgi:hypothetical protein
VGTGAPRPRQTAAFRVDCYFIAHLMQVLLANSSAAAYMRGDKLQRCAAL